MLRTKIHNNLPFSGANEVQYSSADCNFVDLHKKQDALQDSCSGIDISGMLVKESQVFFVRFFSHVNSEATTSVTRQDKAIEAFCEKQLMYHRLQILKTFEGETDIGYVQPQKVAVQAISELLEDMFELAPYLPAPVISPAADGEIIVSWRQPDAYMMWHFEDGSNFEWIAKGKRYHSGMLDSSEQQTIPLAVDMINAVVGNPLEYYGNNYSFSLDGDLSGGMKEINSILDGMVRLFRA